MCGPRPATVRLLQEPRALMTFTNISSQAAQRTAAAAVGGSTSRCFGAQTWHARGDKGRASHPGGEKHCLNWMNHETFSVRHVTDVTALYLEYCDQGNIGQFIESNRDSGRICLEHWI